MPEFELNREIVQVIIDKAHEFHTRDDVNFDEEPEIADDWTSELATDFAGDPYYQRLKATIDDLEPDQQNSVVALMWIGRGDFSIEEWDEALRDAEENRGENTADYLIGTALLADYLEEGLEQFDTAETSE